jgi:hypothetical protein
MSPPKTAALQSTPRQNPSSGANVEHGILKGHRVQGLLVPNDAKLHDGDAVWPRWRPDRQPQLVPVDGSGKEHQYQDDLKADANTPLPQAKQELAAHKKIQST